MVCFCTHIFNKVGIAKHYYTKPLNSCPDYRFFDQNHPKLYFGSVEWANNVLRSGIAELHNRDRVKSAIIQEVSYYLKLLHEKGFWWQERTLESHLYLFFKSLHAESVIPSRGGEGDS